MRKFLFLSIFILTGCNTVKNPGVIYVDRPEVFGRERLINHRADERKWLKDQLDKNPGSTTIGNREFSQASGIKVKAAINFLAGLSGNSSSTNASSKVSQEKPSANKEVRVTSIEELRDKTAYRKEVLRWIRENELDDSHDLGGFTVTSFKFDVSVLPRWRGSEFWKWKNQTHDLIGKVVISVKTNTTNNNIDFERWAKSLENEIGLKVETYRYRFRHDLFSAEELVMLESNRKRVVNKARSGEEQLNFPFYDEVKNVNFADKGDGDSVNELRAIANLALQEYAPLSKYVMFDATNINERVVCKVSVINTNALIHALDDFIKKPFIYTVEPKEYAQNISDQSTREFMLSLALSAAATDPNSGTQTAVDLEYFKNTVALQEAVKRRPLITGFIKSEHECGWLFGPRFELPDRPGKGRIGDLNFTHIPAQHTVQASIALPAWWSSVTISVSNYWENGYSQKVWGGESRRPWYFWPEVGENKWRACRGIETNKYEIGLPANYSALTRMLLEEDTGDSPRPLIYPPSNFSTNNVDHFYAEVDADNACHLILQGENLWRNPKVFINGLATEVETLPDMKSLLVKLDKLPVPVVANTNKPAFADLFLVTSDGSDHIEKAVKIHHKSTGGNPKKTPSVEVLMMTDKDMLLMPDGVKVRRLEE